MTAIWQANQQSEFLQCVLKSRTVENLEGQLTHPPQRFPPRAACPKADDQRLNPSNSLLLKGIQLARFLTLKTSLIDCFGAGSLKLQIVIKNGKRSPEPRACTTL
jgi:hypothetical protein